VKGGERCQEPFLGLPRFLSVISRLNFFNILSVQTSLPKGLPLLTEFRIVFRFSCSSFGIVKVVRKCVFELMFSPYRKFMEPK